MRRGTCEECGETDNLHWDGNYSSWVCDLCSERYEDEPNMRENERDDTNDDMEDEYDEE